MKSIICTLALCLLSVSLSSQAAPKPDSDTLRDLNCATNQIARFNGTAWVCSTDLQGTSNALEVRDAGGERVGSLLAADMVNGTFHALLDLNSSFYSVQFNANGFIQPFEVFFTTGNCTGTPYASQAALDFISRALFDESIVAAPGDTLYIPNGTAIAVNAFSKYLPENDTCQQLSGNPIGAHVPLTPIADLDLTFLTPLQIVPESTP